MYALSSPPPLKPPPLTPRRVPSPALLSPGTRRGRLLASSEEGHLRDLSPDTTLRAFSQKPMPFDTTRDEYKIFRCIENLTAADRDLGIRVAKAAQRLKNWCREIEEWGWSGTFEQPSDEYREQRRKSLELRIREHIGNEALKETVPELDYWGSLLSVEVEAHEARLDDIGDELLELDIEDLKAHVLRMYPSSPSRPSSAGYDASRQNYKPMNDFSFLITQTLLSALPHHSQLKERLSTWTARVSILRTAPRYLEDLKTAQKAMRLGWDAITPPTDNSDVAFDKWKEAVDTISGVLRNKVSGLGQRLDRMLDTLEGRADCLPEDWIDIFEGVEADLGRWTHESRRRVIDFDVRRKMDHSGIEAQHRPSPEKVDAHSGGGVISSPKNDQQSSVPTEKLQAEHNKDDKDLEPHPRTIIESIDGKLETEEFAKSADAEPAPEDSPRSTIVQPKTVENGRPKFEEIVETGDVEAKSKDVLNIAEVEPKFETIAENPDSKSKFEVTMHSSDVKPAPETDTGSTERVTDSASIKPIPKAVTEHTDFEIKFRDIAKTTSAKPSFESTQRTDAKPGSEDITEMTDVGPTSEALPERTGIQSKPRDILEGTTAKSTPQIITDSTNVKPKPEVVTERANIMPETEDIRESIAAKPKPEVVIASLDVKVKPEARADDPDIELSSVTPKPIGVTIPSAEHTIGLPVQQANPELDSPISDDDSIFEEGDTVVHNEIDEETLEDDARIEPMSATFSDSPVIITTTEPENTEMDRPQTPRSRRGSTASNSSNVSFSSSPLSVTDDSPSIRNTSNRQIKAPRPELNAAMAKRRPAKQTNDAPIESAPWPPTQFAHKSPTSADDLESKISDILTTIPAHIRLKTSADPDAHRARHNRSVVNKSSKGYLRATRSISGLKSPEITLSPVKGNFDTAGFASGRKSGAAMRGDNDIKLYHLTQPGKEHPIKLFIRRVGENGERVMVRVGGGWADLGEYLRQYAEHHGRRTVSDGKFEILGLEVKSSDISPNRSESAMSKRDRRFSSGTQADSPSTTPVKSSSQIFTTDEAPPPFPSFISTPGVAADVSAPSTGSTQRSWKGDEVGLAGPRTKKLDLSGDKLEWIEGMMKQARTVSTGSMANTSNTPQQQNERTESRSESRSQSRTAARKQQEFGDLGKVGGTKRIFLRGGGLGEH